MNRIRFNSYCLTVALLAATVGCGDGSSTGKVSGKVSFGSTPLAGSLIIFTDPATGNTFQDEVDADGAYSLNDGQEIAAGNYKVVVTAQPEVTGMGPDGKVVVTQAAMGAKNIPAKYRNPSTTDLVGAVKPGENKLDFTLSN